MRARSSLGLVFSGIFTLLGCGPGMGRARVADGAVDRPSATTVPADEPDRPNSAIDGEVDPPRDAVEAATSLPAAGASDTTPEVHLVDDGVRSPPLGCGLSSPIPGAVTAGYAADTGLDLASPPRDVYAIASGVLEYSEEGHTAWRSSGDSPYAIRLRLDTPISVGDRRVTHVWYAHLSSVVERVHEGDAPVRVVAGQRIGRSGSANGSPHLHLGLLLDGEVEQTSGTFLREDAVRRVLCDLGHKTRLPEPPS